MKVKCIKAKCCDVTKGNMYDVIKEYKEDYTITNDLGETHLVSKIDFEIIEECNKWTTTKRA